MTPQRNLRFLEPGSCPGFFFLLSHHYFRSSSVRAALTSRSLPRSAKRILASSPEKRSRQTNTQFPAIGTETKPHLKSARPVVNDNRKTTGQ